MNSRRMRRPVSTGFTWARDASAVHSPTARERPPATQGPDRAQVAHRPVRPRHPPTHPESQPRPLRAGVWSSSCNVDVPSLRWKRARWGPPGESAARLAHTQWAGPCVWGSQALTRSERSHLGRQVRGLVRQRHRDPPGCACRGREPRPGVRRVLRSVPLRPFVPMVVTNASTSSCSRVLASRSTASRAGRRLGSGRGEVAAVGATRAPRKGPLFPLLTARRYSTPCTYRKFVSATR